MVPVAIFVLVVIPLTGATIYQFMTEPDQSTNRLLFILAIALYFTYRAIFQVRLFVDFKKK